MFYRLNASRITLREFWFETKLFCWAGLIVKLMKVRLRGSTDDLAVESLEPFFVDQSKVPTDRLTRFTETLEQLQAMGFEPPMWLDEEDPYQATRNTIATLRHSSGKAIARVQCRTNFGRHPAKTKFFTTFISRSSDGYIASGNGKYDMAWPRSHDSIRYRAMPVEGVWAEHLRRTAGPAQLVAQTIAPPQVRQVEEAYHVSLRDFHLKRGVFEPLSDEELETYLAPSRTPLPTVTISPAAEELPYEPLAGIAPAAPQTAPDMLELAALDELRQLQNRKVNWRSTMLLLVCSGVLFILFSRNSDQKTDWTYLAIIVGVLLFHETGHFLAMKLFGYRNLRMFFIPGIGAAVTGRNYNAPAWKKIIVSLMGPLPGVFAGAVLMFAGIYWHREMPYRIGMVAILINVLNLIPLLPLDGGWVAHAALFARHPKLDIGFRVAAALIMLSIGLLVPGFKFLPYLGVATLLTLPLAYRQAVIVSELRRVSGLGLSPDNQTIPTDTARIIFARLRERFPRGLNAKNAAQQIAGVFESLNAKPPSIGATLGLLSLHGATFIIGIAAAVAAFALHNRSILRGALARAPRALVTPEQIASKGPAPKGPRNTLVAQFKTAAEASTALGQVEPMRPAMQFGQTLMVDFSQGESEPQRAMFERFQKSAQDVFVETEKMHAAVDIALKVPASTEGKAAISELESYLQNASWRLAPPWADEDVWPASQRQGAEEARALLLKLAAGPEMDQALQTRIGEQIEAAGKRGDDAEVGRLEDQLQNAQKEAQARHVESLRKQFGHTDLIDKWVKITASKDYRAQQDQMKQQIAPVLGQWPSDQPADLLARGGYASDTALLGTRIDVQFFHVDTGLLAMARWLFAHGATDFHYAMHAQRFAIPDQDGVDEQ